MKRRVTDLSEVKELDYNRKYSLSNDKIFDEVCAWIGKQSVFSGYDNGYTYFFLDKQKEKIVRFNSDENIVELSDKVDEEIRKSIEHIIKTEIRAY